MLGLKNLPHRRNGLLPARSGAALSGLALSLLALPGIVCAPNVGVWTSNRLDKLHMTNFIRSDALAITDTNVFLSNLITLDCGGLFTTTGSVTLRIDPSSTAQHATLTIYDLPTN